MSQLNRRNFLTGIITAAVAPVPAVAAAPAKGFYAWGTETGRMSSSRPNYSNVRRSYGEPVALPLELRESIIDNYAMETAMAWYTIWGGGGLEARDAT